jgi:hypothetical protein
MVQALYFTFNRGNFLRSVINRGHAHFFVSPQIFGLIPQSQIRKFFVSSQILGLITQSQIRKFLKWASPQLANPQICND